MILGRTGFIGGVLSTRKLPENWVFNLACCGSPVRQRENPERVIDANTTVVLKVLDHARETGDRVFHASTVDVHSNVPTAYCQGKQIAERLCKIYAAEFGVDVRVARFGNVIGPTMPVDDGRVVPTFVWRAIHDQDLFVYGNALRSFLHVDDAICAMIRLMSGDYKGAVVEVYHPRYVRMVELARIIIDLAKSKSKVIALHAEARDQVHPVPTFTAPTIDLEAALSEIIRRYRDEEGTVHAGDEGVATGDHGTDISAAEAVRQKDGRGVPRDRGEAVS